MRDLVDFEVVLEDSRLQLEVGLDRQWRVGAQSSQSQAGTRFTLVSENVDLLDRVRLCLLLPRMPLLRLLRRPSAKCNYQHKIILFSSSFPLHLPMPCS